VIYRAECAGTGPKEMGRKSEAPRLVAEPGELRCSCGYCCCLVLVVVVAIMIVVTVVIVIAIRGSE